MADPPPNGDRDERVSIPLPFAQAVKATLQVPPPDEKPKKKPRTKKSKA